MSKPRASSRATATGEIATASRPDKTPNKPYSDKNPSTTPKGGQTHVDKLSPSSTSTQQSAIKVEPSTTAAFGNNRFPPSNSPVPQNSKTKATFDKSEPEAAGAPLPDYPREGVQTEKSRSPVKTGPTVQEFSKVIQDTLHDRTKSIRSPSAFTALVSPSAADQSKFVESAQKPKYGRNRHDQDHHKFKSNGKEKHAGITTKVGNKEVHKLKAKRKTRQNVNQQTSTGTTDSDNCSASTATSSSQSDDLNQQQNCSEFKEQQDQQNMRVGVIPPRTFAFQAPCVQLRSPKCRKPGPEERKKNEDDDGFRFTYNLRPNVTTEVTFTVEPRKRPMWQTMMSCGFAPVIYCSVPPCCLAGGNSSQEEAYRNQNSNQNDSDSDGCDEEESSEEN